MRGHGHGRGQGRGHGGRGRPYSRPAEPAPSGSNAPLLPPQQQQWPGQMAGQQHSPNAERNCARRREAAAQKKAAKAAGTVHVAHATTFLGSHTLQELAEREPGYLVRIRRLEKLGMVPASASAEFVQGSSTGSGLKELTLEEEEALYEDAIVYETDNDYRAEEYDDMDYDMEYNDMDYDMEYVSEMDHIKKSNEIFIAAAFDENLSLIIRQDLLVLVCRNCILYNIIYNRMVRNCSIESNCIRLSDSLKSANTTYNVGNMFKYQTCEGKTTKTNKTCPCPLCTEKCTGDMLWMCDSGASDHFTFNLKDFSEYTPFGENDQRWVKTADSLSPLLGEGTIILKHKLRTGKTHLVKLYPVLYMPSASARLISNG